jgi:hypothetical protein
VAVEEYHCYELYTQFNPAFFSQGSLHIQSKSLGIVSVELRVMSQANSVSELVSVGGEKLGG